jgi:hypothetical protein
MSFILEDKLLVDLLVKYAQAQPQQYVAVSPEDVNSVRGLIANLEKQLSGGPAEGGAEITTGSGQAAQLTSMNMKNLSSLVNWMGMNGIKVDGKNVVVGANELPNDPSYVPMRFEGDQTFRPSTQLTFKVNKDLLIKYLQSLQGQLAKNPNPVMRAQVEAIIQEANEQLDTNIGKFQGPAAKLDPGRQLDTLPKDIRTDNPLVQSNDVPLTFGDISSDTGFNGWIQRNNVAVNNRAWRHPQYDKCGLIRVLSVRAKSYVGNATSDQDKAVYNIYATQVGKLASDLQCDLGEATKPGEAEKQKPDAGAGAGAGGAQRTATLAELGDILPLQRDVLDFGRIRTFINAYRGLAAANNDQNRSSQSVNQAMDQAEQYMNAASQNAQNMTTFSMDGLTANDLVQWSSSPNPAQANRNRGSARALADYLEQVVRQVYVIIKDMYNTHYQQFRDPRLANLNQAIQQQVGGPSIPFGSSLASSNMDDIQTARARLPQVGA